MKPFDLEKAKAGHPVCTRDGCEARILCFDKISICSTSIVALYLKDGTEYLETYHNNGKVYLIRDSSKDLCMKSQKREGWVNIYKDSNGTYKNSILIHLSKEDAIKERYLIDNYIDTVKIEWEE